MAGLRLTYSNPRLLRTLLIQLQQQQQAGLFCDVTLQGDDEGIDVHSCVIAACSPYLANLLMSPTEISEVSDSTRRVLKIHGFKSLHLFPLVQYMYTSELKVAPGDVSSVLQAAQKLQIPEVELLKLERGRLVRTDPGRRLNRSCLGSKTRTPCAKAERQGAKSSGTPIPMKPTRNSQNKIENDVDNVSMRGNENTQDTETSSCGVSEIGSSDLGCLENVLSSCSSVEDFAGVHGYLENVPTSRDLLQYVHGTQNSQEDAPPIHNSINDIANSQDLTENVLISQDFMQDVISNQNSPSAESLDLMESELKGLLDYVTCSQDLSEETVNVSDLHNNVPSIKESPEDVQSIGEEFLENMQNIGKDALSTGGLSEEAQSIVVLPEDAQSFGGLPKNSRRVEELPETMQSSRALSENVQNTQENLLKRCRTIPPKRSKSNSEVMLHQEEECFSGQQIRPHAKSRTGLLKRIKLDRKHKEIAFSGEFLKSKCPDVTCSNIDVSDKSEDMLDDHNLLEQCDKPHSHHHGHHLKHTAELKEQLSDEHLVGLKGGQLRTEDKNALNKDGRANEAPIVGSEITDPPVNDGNGNNSVPHTVFGSIKESWSGPMTEMNTGTVAHKGLKSSAHGGSESNRIVDHEGPPSSTHCESETSGAVGQDGLMTSTYDKSETSGTGNQEGLPSSTHCESKTTRTLDQDGLMTRTYSESETIGTGNQEGLPSSTHCESETNRTLDQDGLMTSTYSESKTSGTGNQEGLPSSTHCESETSRTLDQDGLMTSTYSESETIGTGNQEGLPSSTHCESETNRTLDQDGLMTSTYSESETSGTGNQEGLPSSTHWDSETSRTLDQDGLTTSTYSESETSGTGNQEGLSSSTHCESETSRTLDQDGLMTSTYTDSETSGTGNQEGLSSSTHWESETSRTLDQGGLMTSTYSESETSGTGNQEGLPSSAHFEFERNGAADQDNVLSTSCKSKRVEIVDHKCLTSSTNYEYEPSRTVGQVALTSGTYHESERRGTVNPEGVPSRAHCECETNRIVVRDIFLNTYCKSERDGIVDHDKSLDEFQKRCYILDDSEEEKVNIKRTSDAFRWEVKPLNVPCPSKGKEHFKELEEQVEHILNFTTPMSPDVDVGVYSPPMFMEEHLWPDLSSESDMEIDILG